MAISHIPRSVGHNFLPEYQISSVPFVRLSSQATKIVVNNAKGTIVEGADPANPGAGKTTIERILFPKITSWIQFEATSAINVYFSKKDALTPTINNSLKLAANEKTLPLDIRCTSIYFVNNPANNLQITAGLTTIESEEFTETIETFLGDNQ
tara:strand:- start:3074 stop:3532 length:459 start_codon:yes stop_codon:yes gene_type:complete